MAQLQQQPNGSSSGDEELSTIKTDFKDKYDAWLRERKRQNEPQNRRREQSLGEASSPGNAPQLLNGSATSNVASQQKKRVETNSESPGHAIHGFKNEILSLRSFLLNQKDSDDFKALAVVGRYGVGKTALCQKIFNDKAVKNAYVPRLWVSMHKNEEQEDDDPKIAVVKRILETLGVQKETLECIKRDAGEGRRDEELARLLYVMYLNLWGKKYLIVLDDVRTEDGWNQRLSDGEEHIPRGNEWGTHLSCGFAKGSGGRVIVTSRDEDLAKKLVGEEHNLHRLYPLSDSDSVWEIYKDAAKASGHTVNPRNERKYREDVMNKSCGIPLAARMLGKNQPVEEDPEPLAPPVPEADQEGSNHGATATAATATTTTTQNN